jgi:glycine/D-amino acid oxidase-like deaminating enzyme
LQYLSLRARAIEEVSLANTHATTNVQPYRSIPAPRSQTWKMRPWVTAGFSGRSSFWVDQALTDEGGNAERDAHILHGDVRADVCIVGGGFTGLWTAIRMLDHEPSLKVVIVEAELCGTGASGRNGGVMSDWWMETETLLKNWGREDGRRLADAVAIAADDVQSFCEAEGIDANIRREGWIWTATSEQQRAGLQHMLKATHALGAEIYEPVPRDELERKLGSPIHLEGLRHPGGGSLHPARLARGLRRSAIKRGATVYERSPVSRIDALQNTVRITTEGGTVSANRVVMAANAWMAHFKQFRGNTFIVSSDLVATAPVPERFEELGWNSGEVSFDAKAMLLYWRATADKRVVFGNVGRKLGLGPTIEDRWERPSDQLKLEIERALRRTLPRLGNVPLTHAWAGPIDRSSTGLPHIGKLGGDPRITYALGFSGGGVLPTVAVGRCVASTVLERDDEHADLARLLGHTGADFPPEPIRYIGGRVVQKAILSKETAEEMGHRPSPLATALTTALSSDGTHIAPPTMESLRRMLVPKPLRRGA